MAVSERARQLFLAALAERNVTAQALPDGRYSISHGGLTGTVSLENKSRELDETGDEGLFARFVDTILLQGNPVPLRWEEAAPRVYFAAEPADHDFGDTLRKQVSDQVCRILVYFTPDGRNIVWLTPHNLMDWGVELEEVERQAGRNLAELLSTTPIHIEPIDDHKLAMFQTDSPFKASLIFSPNLKEQVSEVVGWPVFAVIPCRDFVYLVGEQDRDLVPRLGEVVVREYEGRGYSISTEVFHISDDGVGAVAEFQRKPAPRAKAPARRKPKEEQ